MMNGRERHLLDINFRKSSNHFKNKGDGTAAEATELIEEYYDTTGEIPFGSALEALADGLLSDELKDANPYKTRHTEYPILSESQAMDRDKRNVQSTSYNDIEPFLIDYATADSYSLRCRVIDETEFRRRRTAPKTKNFRSIRGDEHAEWSRKVKERDNYVCQNPACQRKVGIMHAHHIESYAHNRDLRTEIPNGVTLCIDCHKDFHAKYGLKNANSEQFNEWIEENSVKTVYFSDTYGSKE